MKEAFDSGGPLSGLRYVWYRFWPVVHLLSTPAYMLDIRAAPDLNSGVHARHTSCAGFKFNTINKLFIKLKNKKQKTK